MIHFDFIVSDEEGETLFDLIHDGVIAAVEKSHDNSLDAPTRQWWKGRAEYLNKLKKKMTNRQAPQEKQA